MLKTSIGLYSPETRQMMAMMGLIAVIHFVIEAFIMGTFSRWNLTYDVIEDGLLDSNDIVA